MELKTAINVDGNFVDKKYRNVTIESKKALAEYLCHQLLHAFDRLHSHPIIVLETKLVGTVDDYQINTNASGKKLPIFVADKYMRKDNKNCVFNPLRGNDIYVSDEYVVVNRKGDQLWPPLAANTHSEIEKFANRAFNTVYKVEKVR